MYYDRMTEKYMACSLKLSHFSTVQHKPNSYVKLVDPTATETTATTRTIYSYVAGFLLSKIHGDLEELLIKKLDVRRSGERLYGWQKIGTAFGIRRDDLKYLENAYKKDGGSPTKELLEKLNTQGKSVSDLVNVLKSPNVNYPDLALLIDKHVGIQ